MLLRVLYLSFADISVRSSRILKLFGPEYILCTCSHNNSSLQYNNAVRGHRAGFNNFFFFSSFFSFFPSLLLSSSTRRRFYPQRSSGQAVVTGRYRPFSPLVRAFNFYRAWGSAFPLLVDFHRMLLTHALALSANTIISFKQEKVPTSMCTR